MEVIEYLRELIRFDSVSSKSNVPVTDWLERQLVALDFVTERIDYDDAGVIKSCVVARRGGGAGGMAYLAHSDVVPVDSWDREPDAFTPTISGEKLYGRGSTDMKGSIACLLAAAAETRALPRPHPLYVVVTADEETGYAGAREVAARSQIYREMVAGDARGIIGEPTLLQVVYAHKGSYGFRATARGRAAHSSTSAGLNANLAMIPFLGKMKEIHDRTNDDPDWRNDEFEPPTISWNIGINDHNPAINITSPTSVCTVYFRIMPGQDGGILIEEARQAAEAQGMEFDVRICSEPMYTDPESPIVKEAMDLVATTLDRTRQVAPLTVPYGTDGSAFADLKQKIVLGPGDIAQAHTDDEWVQLEQLQAGTRVYRRLISEWCCEDINS